jgi:hypothetical protein
VAALRRLQRRRPGGLGDRVSGGKQRGTEDTEGHSPIDGTNGGRPATESRSTGWWLMAVVVFR